MIGDSKTFGLNWTLFIGLNHFGNSSSAPKLLTHFENSPSVLKLLNSHLPLLEVLHNINAGDLTTSGKVNLFRYGFVPSSDCVCCAAIFVPHYVVAIGHAWLVIPPFGLVGAILF